MKFGKKCVCYNPRDNSILLRAHYWTTDLGEFKKGMSVNVDNGELCSGDPYEDMQDIRVDVFSFNNVEICN